MGGYSFVVTAGESHPSLLLTALHVMDEMIKKKGIDCTETNKKVYWQGTAGGYHPCGHL